MLPDPAIFRIPVLQRGGNLPGVFFSVFVFFAAQVGGFVKFGNFINIIVQSFVKVAVLFDDFGNNHSHRGSPITEMNVGNHLIAEKTLDSLNRFADNRRAQMPDVHGFGNIGAAEIHHHFFRCFNFGNSEALVSGNLVKNCGNCFVLKRQVDKTGAVN